MDQVNGVLCDVFIFLLWLFLRDFMQTLHFISPAGHLAATYLHI